MALQLGASIVSNTIQLLIGGSIDLNLNVPPPEGYTVITVRYGQFAATAKGPDMAYTLPAGNKIQVQVTYVDANGNPATVDGDVVWASSDESNVSAEVDSANNTICWVSAVGSVVDAQITATADADLGTGTRSLVTLLDVHVVAGEAVAGTVNIVGEYQPIG